MKVHGHYCFLCLTALFSVLWSCSDPDYDLSRGVDIEVTLFSDEVGVPLGGIGPVTLKTFFGVSGMGNIATEDEEGYLIVEDKKNFYNDFALLISYSMENPSAPGTVPVKNSVDTPGYVASAMGAFGFAVSPQSFSLYASNPLTEEIAVSGKVTISSEDLEQSPSETLVSEEYDVKIPAGAQNEMFFSVERSGDKVFYTSKLENMALHLPASMLSLDPNSGMGLFSLDYRYKGYAMLGSDFPMPLDFTVEDISLPLASFRVKQARIRADVSNEIPMTLEFGSLQALVRQTGENGTVSLVPAEGLSVSADAKIASGTYGNPVVSQVELIIEALEGTIPDIDGLQLKIVIKAPSGEGDKRLNMNESMSFNNIRATISGGITIQGK